MKSEFLSVRVPADQYEIVNKAAKRLGKQKSEILREAVANYCSQSIISPEIIGMLKRIAVAKKLTVNELLEEFIANELGNLPTAMLSNLNEEAIAPSVACPECGSPYLRNDGWNATRTKQRRQCKECGKKFTIEPQ